MTFAALALLGQVACKKEYSNLLYLNDDNFDRAIMDHETIFIEITVFSEGW